MARYAAPSNSTSKPKSRTRRVTIIRKIKHRDGSVEVEKRLFREMSVREAVEEMEKGRGGARGRGVVADHQAMMTGEPPIQNFQRLKLD